MTAIGRAAAAAGDDRAPRPWRPRRRRPTTLAAAPPPPVAVRRRGRRADRRRAAPSRRAATDARSAPAPVAAPDPSTLEVLSQPPGASVYLDDELIGATDAEWGRLVRSGVPPGRHRVRLSLAGHRDLVEELELAAGGARGAPPPADPEAAARRSAARGLRRRRRRPARAHRVGAAARRRSAAARRRRRGPRSIPRPRPPRAGRRPAWAAPACTGTPTASSTSASTACWARSAAAAWPRSTRRSGAARSARSSGRCPRSWRSRSSSSASCARRRSAAPSTTRTSSASWSAARWRACRSSPWSSSPARPCRRASSARGRWTRSVAARTIVQVAEALDYAHLKGVVHRDLKPSNVMVLPDGTAKVMDYGIARARRFEGLTVTGSFLGSPEYVAPEAIEGRDTDARSDLYSLGVVFYETLTGRRPFVADTPFAVLRMHLTEPPAPPATVRPGVPPALERHRPAAAGQGARPALRGRRGARPRAAGLPVPRRLTSRSIAAGPGAPPPPSARTGRRRARAQVPAQRPADVLGQDVLQVLERGAAQRRVAAAQRPVGDLQRLALHHQREQREHVGEAALGRRLRRARRSASSMPSGLAVVRPRPAEPAASSRSTAANTASGGTRRTGSRSVIRARVSAACRLTSKLGSASASTSPSAARWVGVPRRTRGIRRRTARSCPGSSSASSSWPVAWGAARRSARSTSRKRSLRASSGMRWPTSAGSPVVGPLQGPPDRLRDRPSAGRPRPGACVVAARPRRSARRGRLRSASAGRMPVRASVIERGAVAHVRRCRGAPRPSAGCPRARPRSRGAAAATRRARRARSRRRRRTSRAGSRRRARRPRPARRTPPASAPSLSNPTSTIVLVGRLRRSGSGVKSSS